MEFSNRTPKDLSQNPLAKAQEVYQGHILDLTLSNPTLCGIEYPPDLLQVLSDPSGSTYEPEPFGALSGRQAISGYLRTRGLEVPPDNILLTTGSSEAVSYALKLLANPGETILVPTPGYPLFEHLATLEGLRVLPYRHEVGIGWPLDRNSFPKGSLPGVKAIISVSPQNPMGCFLSPDDTSFLMDLCSRSGAAFLLDEVFSEYGGSSLPSLPREALSFRFGGLSKSLGLPQLKLSWTILDGPPGPLEEAKERLEFIADSYLSVSTPVQKALPKLLVSAPLLRGRIWERILKNRRIFEGILGGYKGVRVWPVQGGWYGLLEVMGDRTDEELAVSLLEKAGVLVHPGMYFDFPKSSFLVLSLLPQEDQFKDGVLKILKYLEGTTSL